MRRTQYVSREHEAIAKAFDDYAYRRYLIRPLRSGGYCILRDGHCIQHYVPTIPDARRVIDLVLTDVKLEAKRLSALIPHGWDSV